jgi:hypothetical protein
LRIATKGIFASASNWSGVFIPAAVALLFSELYLKTFVKQGATAFSVRVYVTGWAHRVSPAFGGEIYKSLSCFGEKWWVM